MFWKNMIKEKQMEKIVFVKRKYSCKKGK